MRVKLLMERLQISHTQIQCPNYTHTYKDLTLPLWKISTTIVPLNQQLFPLAHTKQGKRYPSLHHSPLSISLSLLVLRTLARDSRPFVTKDLNINCRAHFLSNLTHKLAKVLAYFHGSATCQQAMAAQLKRSVKSREQYMNPTSSLKIISN